MDFPGLPAREQLKAMDDFFENGGPTGDIGKNVTMLCSVGWDWMPPVRDRNIGIWQPVFLRTSGDVTIVQPQVITDLPNLPDTTVARLSLNLSLSNHSQKESKGNLKVTITPENFNGASVLFSKEVIIAAGSISQVALNAGNTAQLQFKQPHLWWQMAAELRTFTEFISGMNRKEKCRMIPLLFLESEQLVRKLSKFPVNTCEEIFMSTGNVFSSPEVLGYPI